MFVSIFVAADAFAGSYYRDQQYDDYPEYEDSGYSEYSTTCQYVRGPKAGTIEYFDPSTPGLRPARVGDYCQDGRYSSGYAIEDY